LDSRLFIANRKSALILAHQSANSNSNRHQRTPSVKVNFLGRLQDNIVIVGLLDAAVKESRDRVSTAPTDSGFRFPMGRTAINLAPADVS
jgi:hypothetical protein